MDITNTMCRLADLTQEQIDSLVEAMPTSRAFEFLEEENFIGFDCNGVAGTWEFMGISDIKTYTEMMQLLGKTMEFTKSDLKTGMFVKQRNGDFKIILGKATFSYDYFMELLSYSDGLTHSNNQKEFDIMSVYKKSSNVPLSYYLKGQDLTLIWERTEQTEAQKEMEELQAQITKLQEQAKVLQSKL
jgi:hypothetical protein